MDDQSPGTDGNGKINVDMSDVVSGFGIGRDGLVELSPIVRLRMGKSVLEMKYAGLDSLGKVSILPMLLEHGNPNHPEVLQLALPVDLAKTIQTQLAELLDQSE